MGQDLQTKENQMKYWLQSLSQNGFDVFTLVYIAILLIVYHYLQRWFINKKFEQIEAMLLEIFDEVEK